MIPRFSAALLALTLSAQTGYSVSEPATLAQIQRHLGLPDSIGRVSDSWGVDRQSEPRYILLEDIHEHPEAQGSIAAMILYGRKAWNVRTVFFEGAPAGLIPRVGVIGGSQSTGVEQAMALDISRSLVFYGLEDMAVYKHNLEAYDRLSRLRQDALDELHTLRLLRRTLDWTASKQAMWDAYEKRVTLKLKPSDYEEIRRADTPIPASPALSQALAWSDAFYRLADARSAIFLDHLRQSSDSAPQILVVGGFHTPAMTSQWRARGESYVVISPRVTRTAPESRYERRMEESINALLRSEPAR